MAVYKNECTFIFLTTKPHCYIYKHSLEWARGDIHRRAFKIMGCLSKGLFFPLSFPNLFLSEVFFYKEHQMKNNNVMGWRMWGVIQLNGFFNGYITFTVVYILYLLTRWWRIRFKISFMPSKNILYLLRRKMVIPFMCGTQLYKNNKKTKGKSWSGAHWTIFFLELFCKKKLGWTSLVWKELERWWEWKQWKGKWMKIE